MKKLYLCDQDVESLLADYLANNNEKAGDGLTVDIDKEFDNDGDIVGVRFNFLDNSGSIVTGYEEIFGAWQDRFAPVDMQDGEGGTVYVQRKNDIPQFS